MNLEAAIQIGLKGLEKVTQELCLKSMDQAGLFILPSGAGFEKLNSDLRLACVTEMPKLIVRLKVSEEVAARKLDEIASKAKRKKNYSHWSCPHEGCSYSTKNKYKKNQQGLNLAQVHEAECAFKPESLSARRRNRGN